MSRASDVIVTGDITLDWHFVRLATPASVSVHVIDDGGLGFRERPELWPRIDPGLAWILLKTARPVLTGPLWTHLSAGYADRLVVIVTADDLRAAQAQISADSSWERTAQDLVWEGARNPRFSALAAGAHVIVSFGPAGAGVAVSSWMIAIAFCAATSSDDAMLVDHRAHSPLVGRYGATDSSSSRTSSGSMKSYSSGMWSVTTRLPASAEPTRFQRTFRCRFSITKTTSAHSTVSAETGTCASRSVPAERTSSPGRPLNTRSAVGLRSRFWLHRKSTFMAL